MSGAIYFGGSQRANKHSQWSKHGYTRLALAFSITVFLIIFHIFFTHVLLFPTIQPLTETPTKYGLPWKSVSFQIPGIPGSGIIAAWIIPSRKVTDRWVILLHGRARNRTAVLKFAPGLHAAGYSLLLPDFPGHGESSPSPVTLGAFEKQAVRGMVGYLESFGIEKIGILGLSMGGTSAILAAAEDPRIDAVVADSPYTTFTRIVSERGWKDYKIPGFPFSHTESAFAGMLYRFNPFDVDAARAAAELSPRGLLLIHGSSDTYVPKIHSEEIFSGAREPKELWVVEGAKHARAFDRDPDAYIQRVHRFFKRHL